MQCARGCRGRSLSGFRCRGTVIRSQGFRSKMTCVVGHIVKCISFHNLWSHNGGDSPCPRSPHLGMGSSLTWLSIS